MKVSISAPNPRPSNDIFLTSGWNSSLVGKLTTKKKWTLRGLVLGIGSIFLVIGLTMMLVFDSFGGLYELGLGAGLILVVWPFMEWAMKQKAFMGTSIDLVGIEKWELYRILEEYLRSRGFRFRRNQEDFRIMKGVGFELTDSAVRLTIFEVKPMHLSSGAPLLKSPKASRLGIRNIDPGNVQTGIALQIDLDKIFTEKGIKGSPPRQKTIIYRWNGKGYDTIV